MNRARWFALVVSLQVALLVGWAGYHEWNRTTAPTILLETAPVDPRDLLRGDYMILSYKISRVPVPPNGGDAGVQRREIWVTLRQNGRFHEVAGSSWTAPGTVAVGLIVVRGRAQPGSGNGFIRVDYDIEKYFVPEGRGQPRFKEMVVEATVSKTQQLGIKRLLLDGHPYP